MYRHTSSRRNGKNGDIARILNFSTTNCIVQQHNGDCKRIISEDALVTYGCQFFYLLSLIVSEYFGKMTLTPATDLRGTRAILQ